MKRLGQKIAGVFLTIQNFKTVVNNKVRVQVNAVNILINTPIAKVRANPLTKPDPKLNRAPQAIKVVILLSKILEKAR